MVYPEPYKEFNRQLHLPESALEQAAYMDYQISAVSIAEMGATKSETSDLDPTRRQIEVAACLVIPRSNHRDLPRGFTNFV